MDGMYAIVKEVLGHVSPGGLATSFSGTEQVVLLRYGWSFEQLWRFPSELQEWLNTGNRTLVLYWDELILDTMLENSGLADHLTPLDWGLLVSLGESRPKSTWRILILDDASDHHPASPAVRLTRTLENDGSTFLPWMKLFRPAQVDRLYSAIPEPAPVHGTKIDLDMWKAVWAAGLVNPAQASQRHAIVNLTAPHLLLAGLGGEQAIENPHVMALDELLLRLGLRETEADCQPGPWVGPAEWEGLADRFLLVDDLQAAGWKAVLQQALGARSEQLQTENSGQLWEQWLDTTERLVIFLDLRLFAIAGPEVEFRFYADLIVRAIDAGVAIAANDLEAMREAIRVQSSHHSGYYACLTLLPRLLATLDPTLPIVIFSSTGRREVVQEFAAHANVITDFDKPRFFGDSSHGVLLETRRRFEIAMKKALVIAAGRNARVSWIRTVNPPPAPGPVVPETPYVELYLDESGYENRDSTFAVGGMALLYPNEQGVAKLAAALASEGVSWSKKRPPMHVDSETFDYEFWLAKVGRALQKAGVGIAAFGLRQEDLTRPSGQLCTFTSDERFDHLYRNMLTEAVESMVFDCLGEEIRSCMGLGLYLPTRILPVPGGMTAKQMNEDWGAEIHSRSGSNGDAVPEMFYRATMPGDARRVLFQALRSRPRAGAAIPVRLARAIRLQEGARVEKNSLAPREIHYLADWLARFSQWPSADIPETARSWFASGFLARRNAGYAAWLECGRAGDRGDRAAAVYHACAARRAEPDSFAALGRHFVRVVPPWARDLSSTEFYRLCRLLDASPAGTASRRTVAGG